MRYNHSMNNLIDSAWTPIISTNKVNILEASDIDVPRWWKMVDTQGDMAFVAFSFYQHTTPEKAFYQHAVKVNDLNFNLLWIESIWVPHERRKMRYGFTLLNHLQNHFKKSDLFYCGLNVCPFEDGIDFEKLKTGYLQQGFSTVPYHQTLLLKTLN